MKRIALFIITLFVCVICRADTFNQYWYVEDNAPIQTSCTTGGDIILPTSPTKYGYDFIGWEKLPLQRIEYLVANGNTWIDTNYIPNSNTGIKTKIEFAGISNTDAISFGMAQDNDKRFNSFLWNNQLYFWYGNQYRILDTFHTGDMLEVDWNKNTVSYSVNNIPKNTVIFTSQSFAFTRRITFFIGNYMDNDKSNSILSGGKIYYFQIYDNDVLVRDFIPVLDPAGIPCMFDKVEGKFYYNAGTGQFIAGPVIGSGE